jgi:ATP-dependent Lon protease
MREAPSRGSRHDNWSLARQLAPTFTVCCPGVPSTLVAARSADEVALEQESFAGELDRSAIVAPRTLPVLPMQDSVTFPGAIVPISIARSSSVWMIRALATLGRRAGRNPLILVANAGRDDVNEIQMTGCAVQLLDLGAWWRRQFGVVVQGVSRVRIDKWLRGWPFRTAQVTFLPDPTPVMDEELASLAKTLEALALDATRNLKHRHRAAETIASARANPFLLADCIASNTEGAVHQKQRLLETADVKERIRLVTDLVRENLASAGETAPA